LTNALLTPPRTRSALNYPSHVVANRVSLPSAKAGSSGRAPMGSVVTTIFFAEVDTYYDGAKDTQGGPPSNVFIDCDGGRCRSSRQHPQGARRRTSSSTTMVAAAGAPGSTPRGPAVDVFIDYDGGATGAPGSTTRGPAIDVCLKTWYLSPAFLLRDTYQGATMANTTMADRTKFHRKIFLEKG
jgi:hypothetical protein